MASSSIKVSLATISILTLLSGTLIDSSVFYSSFVRSATSFSGHNTNVRLGFMPIPEAA
jgi:hypothetical protein